MTEQNKTLARALRQLAADPNYDADVWPLAERLAEILEPKQGNLCQRDGDSYEAIPPEATPGPVPLAMPYLCVSPADPDDRERGHRIRLVIDEYEISDGTGLPLTGEQGDFLAGAMLSFLLMEQTPQPDPAGKVADRKYGTIFSGKVADAGLMLERLYEPSFHGERILHGVKDAVDTIREVITTIKDLPGDVFGIYAVPMCSIGPTYDLPDLPATDPKEER